MSTRESNLDLAKEVRRAASLADARFGHIGPAAEGDEALPQGEADVDKFIKARTRIHRESWILPQLDCLVARLEIANLGGPARKLLDAVYRQSVVKPQGTGVEAAEVFPHPHAADVAQGERQLIGKGLARRNPGHPSRLQITETGRQLVADSKKF